MDLPVFTQPFKRPPKSKQKVIVFPYNRNGYSLIKFNETLLQDRCTRADVERVLHAVRPVQPINKVPGVCAVLIILALFFTWILTVEFKPRRELRIKIALLFVCIASCACCSLILCCQYAKSRRKKNVHEILETFNQMEF